MDEQTGPEPQSPAQTQQTPDASREPYRGEVVPPASKGSAEPEHERAGRRGGRTVGMIVIIVGVIFLGKNAGWFGTGWGFHNWWLVPKCHFPRTLTEITA